MLRLYLTILTIAFVVLLTFNALCQSTSSKQKWYRGNMHTHTYWSDGKDFPENVAEWYKNNGYNFLVFTDHDIMLKQPVSGEILIDRHVLIDGELWVRTPSKDPALVKYSAKFPKSWVDIRKDYEDNYVQVRLKSLEEFRKYYERPEQFLLMEGNEISNVEHRIHLLAYHLDTIIPTVKREDRSEYDALDVIEDVVKRINDYREGSGRKTNAILAHPNFFWGVTAELMIESKDLRYFEVANSCPPEWINNEGDGDRVSTERMWDIVLAMRLGSPDGKILYGLATDDAHHYSGSGGTPGRGWVMVSGERLTPNSLLNSIDNGEFYASTGVLINEIKFDGKELSVEIDAQPGVEYSIEYIGTLKGFDPSSEPTVDDEGNEIPNTTRTYSEDIGRVLFRSSEVRSSYTLTGKEMYVRAKVNSSEKRIDKITGEVLEPGNQSAWIQPVVRGGSAWSK